MPDSRDYAQPTITADRARLHLEARYNYEALATGWAWAGYKFGGGEKLASPFSGSSRISVEELMASRVGVKRLAGGGNLSQNRTLIG